MSKPNGYEAMMTRLLESQIQLAHNQVLMDTRHQETMTRIDQRFDRIEQRMLRLEQKIDVLPEEVYRKQVGFKSQAPA